MRRGPRPGHQRSGEHPRPETQGNARKVTLTGSVKWREQSPFSQRDLAYLIEQRASVPGAADAALVGVSRSGFATGGLDRTYGPEDLVEAWRTTR